MNDQNTEQKILDAAEQIFQKRGFAASTTTEIAELAGVNHALLHYYFRSKEKLFNNIFIRKTSIFYELFNVVSDQDIPFMDLVELLVSYQYDFFSENKQICTFVLTEIWINPKRKVVFQESIFPYISRSFDKFEQRLKAEIAKGTIIDINPFDFYYTTLSLNISTIFFNQVIEDSPLAQKDAYTNFQSSDRKKTNIEIIKSWIQK